MELIKKNLFKQEYIRKLLFLFLILSNVYSCFVLAQEDYKLKDIEINSSTKLDIDEKENTIPTNPFEIVDMIRRANSMNDATIPSDAIDEALKSFDMIKTNKD